VCRAPRLSRLTRSATVALAALLWFTTPLRAQYPGELAGRITDAVSGEAVPGALVAIVGTGINTLSDGRGEFLLRGLEPGDWTVRISRLGYATAERTVSIRNGQRGRLDVRLGVHPVAIHGIEAVGARTTAPAAIHIDRAEIEARGARNVAEALEGRAGLLIEGRGPGAPKTISIRGSGEDDVLVLLDGAPLNGPLTGSADLTSVPASQVESITVIKGSASARYGPGAQAGVVLIETRSQPQPTRLLLGSGSLGAWRAEGEAGIGGAPHLMAGFHASGLDGRFDFSSPALPSEPATRDNADLLELGGFIAGQGNLAGGRLRLRAGYSGLERGLPGRSFLQSPHAREEFDRWRGQASWERELGEARLALDAHALHQGARFSDPAPPVGLPYDSRTTATSVGGDLVLELEAGPHISSLLFGLDLEDQRYESSELMDSAPSGRLDFGVFAGSGLRTGASPAWPELLATLRLDRDGTADIWRLTHELTARAALAGLEVHARHASSYKPPSFGDQYFKHGVAVQPNPDLRAERVSAELAAGIAIAGGLPFATRGRLAVEAYRADVRDMIVWAPDFRFVWSPRNSDVRRRGLDVEGTLSLLRYSLELTAGYSYNRAVYDRPGADTVQLIYRPLHSGSARLGWEPGRWNLAIESRYTGTRYPVPARVNALDPFWTLALRAARDLNLAGWRVTPVLRVERLLDNDDSLIFGFPEPGRTLQLDVTLRRY